MREIKFRAWNSATNKMQYPVGLKDLFDDGADAQTMNDVYTWSLGKYDFSDLTWLQYTGLKDKNGKEIYEGDIVKGVMAAGGGMQRRPGKPCNFEIIVHTGGWGDQFQLRRITKLTGDYRSYPNFNQVEVIGNIYESKELLNENN